MALLNMIWRTLLPYLLSDARLRPIDIKTCLQLLMNPITTLRDHARVSTSTYETLRRSVHRLIDLGWAYKIESGSGFVVIPWMPLEVEQAVAAELTRTRDEVSYVGEWLMRCFLDLVVDDRDFRDNARLEWLVLGDGSGRLELDRWYRSAKVAFEFQGPQHFRIPTTHAKTPSVLDRQIQRDHVKAGICSRQGIRLIEITAHDLHEQGILNAISGVLPQRPYKTDGPLCRTLSNMCESYRNYAVREERRNLRDEHLDGVSR